MQDLLTDLNEKQKEAVVTTKGPCLVIAGAGSGKTKVLTHKIAYLMSEENMKPWNILAITFTKKAATEMNERIKALVGDVVNDMWNGTFHSICVRILRKTIDRIGYTNNFLIYDTLDQRALVKECMKTLDIDDKMFTDRVVLAEISNAKNEMLEPDEYSKIYQNDFRKSTISKIYTLYQKKLKENNVVDFDDIINYTIKILLENPDVLDYYADKFKYVLVDEYQDTNKSQFTLVTILASKNGNITVVGDNDQGIYSFRGADISNILNFEKDFAGTKIIKLEQNYRCTGNILKAANAVIKNNENKYEKKLWTQNEDGVLPCIHKADDEYDEGRYIADQISHLKSSEYYKYSDFAVLYRMNSQSRAVEEILRREAIPYKVVGGLKFFERKEIKDLISYLRVVFNQSDNISLKRIINEPKRGIGKTSLDNIQLISEQTGISMYDIIKKGEEYGIEKIKSKAESFLLMIEELKLKIEEIKISDMIKEILHKSKYVEMLKEEKTIENQSRIQNLDEFLTVAMEFEEQEANNDLGTFLEGIILSNDIGENEEDNNMVTLMTLHSAKGLEFNSVFLVGMEENIFPGKKSTDDPVELEEERRLFYVGITRAKRNLYLTCSKKRTIFGSTSFNQISRFVDEIPVELLDGMKDLKINKLNNIDNNVTKEWSSIIKNNSENKINRNNGFVFRTPNSVINNKIDISNYKENQNVFHKKFGRGIIIKLESEGSDFKASIKFEKENNIKVLMLNYAGLEILE